MLIDQLRTDGSKYIVGQVRHVLIRVTFYPCVFLRPPVWPLTKSSALIVRVAVRPRSSAVAPQPF